MQRNSVRLLRDTADRRKPELVALSDLPPPVRRAWQEREAAQVFVAPGAYDEAAHDALHRAPATMQAEAQRKAAIVSFIKARGAVGAKVKEIYAAVRKEFGTEGNSGASLRRWQADVRGVDPVNLAPALLDDFNGKQEAAEISPEAWAMFEGGLEAAFQTHRKTALHDDVARMAPAKGWLWPSCQTVLRRFHKLPQVEKVALVHGRDEAHRRCYQPTLRDQTALRAMEWLVLDGRTADVWVSWPDGTVSRPVLIALCDQASGKIMGYRVCTSENAEDTAALERDTLAVWGAPDSGIPSLYGVRRTTF